MKGQMNMEKKLNKIEQFIVDNGFDLNKLKNDTTVYKVTNLDKAADAIKTAVLTNRHIHVIADYDCDGVMSGCNMYLILKELGADFTIRFPRRMSEGYGISEKIVAEIPDNSLVITIDNGIAAVEAIDSANARGMNVIILDHHQMRGDGLIPNAECVVDPHIYKANDEFEHYCGAGLSYMLAKELNLPEETIGKTNVLAAIATIQDVVPLVDNNRNIVKSGLLALNAKAVDLPGLYSLCSAMKLTPSLDALACINEEDVSFQIGPCINAMGRMMDDGAAEAFKNLMHYDVYGEDGIRELVNCNTDRKNLTTKQQNILDVLAETSRTNKTTCMVLYSVGLNEGIIGINAAKVCEKYNMPAIVFTDSEENGILKGSARSVEGINMKELLDKVANYVYKYGGHAGAAGLSIEKSKLDDFTKAINAITPKATTASMNWTYDIEIEEKYIGNALKVLRRFAPYGEGFRAPVFKVNNYNLVKTYGKYCRYIGETGVSFNGANSDAVSFTLKEKYRSIGAPLNMNVVGTLGYSRWSKKPQVIINDFQPIIQKQDVGFLI